MELTPDRELKHICITQYKNLLTDGTYSRQGIETCISFCVPPFALSMELTPDRELKLLFSESICVATLMELTPDRELKLHSSSAAVLLRTAMELTPDRELKQTSCSLRILAVRWNLLPTGN